ncbi:predicted ATPase [Bellilinea caldifistulae]|uniref:ATP-binding protein n=1 Tax=Bellilinea caldifistulae TaxID=360411 RepID=A0A0P6XQT1_9CHLR|nr:ATP-binding protein [Bellilinea caldifistulae]KPL77614.1 hypothetical protein AC812_03585 [Bellilinea caldifistulae]GAP09585.1 predicted ATPase [Bellilinea caldifistulae]
MIPTPAPLAPANQIKPVSPMRILFWLIVHPSAWQRYLGRIDPALPLDFSLSELTDEQRRNRPLISLLISTWLRLGVWVALLIPLFRLIFGDSLHDLPLNLAIGVSYALSASVGGALLSGFGSGLTFGFVLGLGIGLLPQDMDAYFVVTAAAAGMAASVQLNLLQVRQRPTSILRCLWGTVTGILVSIGVIWGFWVIASGELINTPQTLQIDQTISGSTLVLLIGSGLPVGFSTVWLTLHLRSRRGWRQVLLPAILLTVWMTFGYAGLVSQSSQAILMNVNAGMIGGVFIPLLFGLSSTLTRQIGGNNAAAVASSLVAGIGWIPIGPHVLGGYQHHPHVITTALVVLVFGLTISFWRPLVFYPLVAIWNNLCFNLDQNRPAELRWFWLHAAFWDEKQRLIWPDLDEYLLLLFERQPEMLQDVLLYLSATAQRSVAQKVQIELTARQFEACKDVHSLASIRHRTAVGLLEGPLSTILIALHNISRDVDHALRQNTPYQQRLGLGMARDKLATLQNELLLSRDPQSQRFSPIIAQWQHILVSHIEAMTIPAQYQQEIPNPYICGMPLSEQQSLLFVGRSEIIERINQMLMQEKCPPLLLFGQRRMGKTSLLLNLSHFLASNIIPCFVDCQGLAGFQDSDELVPEFVELVRQSALRFRNIELPPFKSQLSSGNGSLYQMLNHWLAATEKQLESHQQTLLLAMDEFESLELLMNANLNLARLYLGFARHTVQHHPRFKILLAGTHLPEEMPLWRDFLINARVLKIEYLTRAETLQLIEQPVKPFPLTYPPDVSQAIYEMTRGHPYLVQSLCFELVMLKNEQPLASRFRVSSADLEEALQRAHRANMIFFNDLAHNQLSPLAASMAIALARQGAAAYLSADEWQQIFPTYSASGLADLLRRDVIEAVNGGYRFQVEFIRRWFAEQPITFYSQSSAS